MDTTEIKKIIQEAGEKLNPHWQVIYDLEKELNSKFPEFKITCGAKLTDGEQLKSDIDIRFKS